eukprot:1436768-Pyramimonas_sp.AAC.1
MLLVAMPAAVGIHEPTTSLVPREGGGGSKGGARPSWQQLSLQDLRCHPSSQQPPQPPRCNRNGRRRLCRANSTGTAHGNATRTTCSRTVQSRRGGLT